MEEPMEMFMKQILTSYLIPAVVEVVREEQLRKDLGPGGIYMKTKLEKVEKE